MKSKSSPNGLASLAPDALESRRALRHEVVRRLLLEIFKGNLPAGTRLITQTLAKQLGISATPLREALVELESVGMVEISHNRGAVAASFDPDQLRGIYQVRRVLESEAARCACGRMDPAVLESLREQFQEYLGRRSKSTAWLRSVMAADGRFHSIIAESCGSQRLAREIDRYALLMKTISEAIGNQYRSQEDGIAEHLEIIDALLAGDSDRCGRAMARHIDASANRAIDVMFAHEAKGR